MPFSPEALDDIYAEETAVFELPEERTPNIIDLLGEIDAALRDQPLDDDPRAEAEFQDTLQEFEIIGRSAVGKLVEIEAHPLYSGQTSDGRVIPLESEFPDPDLLFSETVRQQAYKALQSSKPAPEKLMRKLDAIILANDSHQAQYFLDALVIHNQCMAAPRRVTGEEIDITQFDNVTRIY